MFGTLGFSELIIILAIILIIFGAGRLPQIGEGLGKALKGFKKEVHEAPPPLDPNAPPSGSAQPTVQDAQVTSQQQAASAPSTPRPAAPYQPGPEVTPGTTAAIMAAGAGPQFAQAPRPPAPSQAPAQAPTQAPAQGTGHAPAPPSMEARMGQPPPAPRASYPPLPPSARPAATPPKRPSAIVNKEAVARIQAQQVALKASAAPQSQAKAAPQAAAPSPQDMQSLGEGIGDALRTFRQAVADVRGSIDPEMRTIQAELDAAQKEIEQTVETAKQMPAVQEDPPKSS